MAERRASARHVAISCRAWLSLTLWVGVISGLLGCPSVHDVPIDAPVPVSDSGPACLPERTMTLVVVVNSDGINELRRARADAVAALVEALLSGDVDGDDVPDVTPFEEIRVMATSNEICVPGIEGYDGQFTGRPLADCGLDPESRVQRVRADVAWREELDCRLRAWTDATPCVDEPLEVALIALGGADDGLDVSPAVPLGDTANAAWRERDDLVLLVLEAADWRDDCSRRAHTSGPSDVCDPPGRGGGGWCCAENLPPVSRTAEGLRRIFGDRPHLVASIGRHGSFDASADDPAQLDAWLAGEPACPPAPIPHLRMIELAQQLYPRMDLVELACDDEAVDVAPLARHAASFLCP